MKGLKLCFIFLCVIKSVSAQVIADFETPALTPTLSGQDGGTVLVVDNPMLAGNSSSKVAHYQKPVGNWKALYLNFDSKKNVGINDRLTFKLRSTTLGRVFVKIVDGSTILLEDWAPTYAFMPSPFVWTECILDISTLANQEFDRIEINASVDNEAPADIFVDDFKLSSSLSPDGEPVIDVEVSSLELMPGESFQVDASGSVDFDGTIVSYLWDFGDGQTASTAQANYAFQTEGIKQVSLVVEDNDGKKAYWIQDIYVFPATGKLGVLSFSEVPVKFGKAEGRFLVKGDFTNAYDPDIVKVDALITYPDASTKQIPCFYFEKASYNPISDRWAKTSGKGYWLLRFTSDQTGDHEIQLQLVDGEGTSTSSAYGLAIVDSEKKGIIKPDADNKQYYRHSTGEPFYPLGINVAWNTTSNYHTIINSLANGGANLVRYWQAPFDRQGLEWREGSGFYQGLGVYSQEAAAEQDSIFSLCESLDMYLQVTLFQHGMFSETVDSNWGDNPYNVANGGPLTQSEQYFYNAEAKQRTRKLLRYIVARWGYSSNLFAWELFNEVNFTGSFPNQSSQWLPAVKNWHDEMGMHIKSLDAFAHPVTTSSDESHLLDMDKLDGLDIVQYHLYNTNLLSVQISKDKELLSKVTRTGVINGEYGLDVTTADVPLDVQRTSIWTGIMTQVPHLMWKWENYANTTWSNLFTFPSQYLDGEDLVAEGELNDWTFTAKRENVSFQSVGFSSSESFYGIVYDANHQNNLTQVTCDFSELPFGNYNLELYNVQTGEVAQTELEIIPGNKSFELPVFSKAVPFKAKFASPLSTVFAFAGENRSGAVGEVTNLDGAGSYNPFAEPLVYQWSLLEIPTGSTASLLSGSGVQTTFVPDVPGEYQVSLTVSANGHTSEPYTIIVTVENVTSIEKTWLEQISIYPNPSTGTVYFNIPNIDRHALQVCVIDVMGRVIKQANYQKEDTSVIELRQMPAGIYVVKLSSPNTSVTKKVMIIDSQSAK